MTSLEEVRLAVGVLEGRVEVIGDAVPVGDGLRVGGVQLDRSFRVELPVLRALEEVDLVVGRPGESGINVVWDPGEANTDFSGVVRVHLARSGEPPVLGALEEVGLAIGVTEGGVQVTGKTVPV